MSEQRIDPERVTKPIQLLAAWLVGLIVVDGSFLIAAGQMAAGSWERGALVIAAIANVPVFLVALFLLQTRFRPELQEDSYYSHYLDRRTNQVVTVSRDEFVEKELAAIRSEVRLIAAKTEEPGIETPASALRGKALRVGLNQGLPDFDALRALLRDLSIPLDDVFGTSDPLDDRTIAIADTLPYHQRFAALRLGISMKMTGYSYIVEEEGIPQDVLIGAYGGSSFPLADDLQRLLDDSPEPADLRLYESRHRIRRVRTE